MRCWAATVSADRFAGERLYTFDTLTLPKAAASVAPAVGEPVALVVAGTPPRLFGLGQVRELVGTDLVVAYAHRLFDEPVAVADLLPGPADPGLTELDADTYARLAGRSGPVHTEPARQEWFVSVSLPIEAASPAEAVREFWTYLAKLGPRELPAFVWPRGDELAMRAFVLGEEANQDPEED